MFHTPTETPSDEVMSPKGGVGWGGWIEITGGGRIASIEPLNVDHFTDQFHQVDAQRIWFTVRTRGDFDGVLIRLAQSPADTQVRVIVSSLTGSAGGTGASGNVTWPVGAPQRTPLHEFQTERCGAETGRVQAGAERIRLRAQGASEWRVGCVVQLSPD